MRRLLFLFALIPCACSSAPTAPPASKAADAGTDAATGTPATGDVPPLGGTCGAGCAGVDHCVVPSTECASGLCLFDGKNAYCTAKCTTSCPADYACVSYPDFSGGAATTDTVCARNAPPATPDGCANGWCRTAVDLGSTLRTVGDALFVLSGQPDSTISPGTGRVRRVPDTGTGLVDVGTTLPGAIDDLAGVDATHLVGVGSEFGKGKSYRLAGADFTSADLAFDDPNSGAFLFPFAVYAPNADDLFVLAGDEFATANHVVGNAVQPGPNVGTHGVLFGYAANDVWVLGYEAPQHWNGTTWETKPMAPSSCRVGTAFGAHRGVCFADDMTRALDFDGTSWSATTSPAPSGAHAVAVVRRGAGYVVLAAANGALEDARLWAYDGAAFTAVPVATDTTFQPSSVGALADGRIAFIAGSVGAGAFLHTQIAP